MFPVMVAGLIYLTFSTIAGVLYQPGSLIILLGRSHAPLPFGIVWVIRTGLMTFATGFFAIDVAARLCDMSSNGLMLRLVMLGSAVVSSLPSLILGAEVGMGRLEKAATLTANVLAMYGAILHWQAFCPP